MLARSVDRAEIAASTFELGIVSVMQGAYEATQTRYERALSIWCQLDDPAAQADALEQLGLLHQLRREQALARVFFEQARELRVK